jgi:hypothetical protein
MPTERERIALLEQQVAELRAGGGATRRRRPPLQPRSRARRGLTVVGLALALALALLPAITVASHSFSDVPNSHTFHSHIAAVKDAGVTSGCTATTFCPEAFVTRGQMAAFLNRLGALAPGTTPVVNADRLDGLDSTEFSRPAYATMRPDECFLGPGNHCTIYNVKDVSSIRRIATGTYCVAPVAGRSFAGKTPALTIDGFHSGPRTGFGVPIVTYSSLLGLCSAGEMRVLTYAATGSAGMTIALSNTTSFGIVIP